MLDDSLLYISPTKTDDPERKFPTWGEDGVINRRAVERLKKFQEEAETYHYKWTFGREQEFVLSEKNPGQNHAFIEQKTTELASKIKDGSINASNLKSMTPQEIFMVDLHQRLKDVLEPRAKEDFHGIQGEGVLEVSTKPCDPVNDVKQFNLLIHTLQEMAHEYGFNMTFHKRDITFKAFDTSDPAKAKVSLFQTQSSNPDSEKGLRISEGILLAIYEASPVFFKQTEIEKYLEGKPLNIGYGRHHTLRSRDDRLEIRTNHNPMGGSHAALEDLVILSGARYSITHGKTPNYQSLTTPSIYTEKALFTGNEDNLFFMSEVLNGSKVHSDGKVEAPPELASPLGKYGRYLSREMHMKQGGMSLREWLSHVKFHEGDIIKWPKAELISDDPDYLRGELARISYGHKMPRIRNEGIVPQLIDYSVEVHPKDCMKAAIMNMASGEVMQTQIGYGLTQDISQGYADYYRFNDLDLGSSPKRGGR